MPSVRNSSYVVTPPGDITWQCARGLRDTLSDLIDQHYRTVVVNFSQVTHIDSAGLAILMAANRMAQHHGVMLIIVNVPARIMRAFEKFRLSELLPVRGSRTFSHAILPEPVSKPLLVRTYSVPCDPARMNETRRLVTELIESFSIPRNTVFDITLAFGEALGNAFDHGSDHGRKGAGRPSGAAASHAGPHADRHSIQISSSAPRDADVANGVTVSVSRFSDRVVLEVTDCGCGMTFDAGDELPEASEMRGRGIRLMTMLMDSVTIRPKQNGNGSLVRLVKMIQTPAV